jgi:hypothetical protein
MSRLRSFLAYLALMGGSIGGLANLAWWYVVPVGMLLLWISEALKVTKRHVTNSSTSADSAYLVKT